MQVAAGKQRERASQLCPSEVMTLLSRGSGINGPGNNGKPLIKLGRTAFPLKKEQKEWPSASYQVLK
jgi:hypothetical protein